MTGPEQHGPEREDEEVSRTLPGTTLLDWCADRPAQMVAGIDRFLEEETRRRAAARSGRWQRVFSSAEAYVHSIDPNRERLRTMLGLSDARLPPDLRTESRPGEAAAIGEGSGYRVDAVRWSVLPGVDGEGLLLTPHSSPVADIVALPDCDQTPEMLVGLVPGIPPEARFAARLAENGCRVLVPALIDRRDTFSGVAGVRMTNQPHREFIHRGAFEMGRTMIGYEVQTTLAAIDWFMQTGDRPKGTAGTGEGGLVAFYAAAVDPRVSAALVAGYFQPREALWTEPIYRCLYGLLAEFGDAEIASLIAPRCLVVEASAHPEVPGPPETEGRSGAAPGKLSTPATEAVSAEFQRAAELAGPFAASLTLIDSEHGLRESGLPGSDAALTAFLAGLGYHQPLRPPGASPQPLRPLPDPAGRLERQFRSILDHIQHLVTEAPYRRKEFWAEADSSSVERWQETTRPYREIFWDRVLGRLPPASAPANPQSVLLYDTPHFSGYEVTLDVYPDVFASGILLVPKDIRPEERRPVVVCQHGLEGQPLDTADPTLDNQYYHQFACRLAEEGFVTYSPQNPYIGGDRFRVLLRKARPLGLTLFSVIVRQHERTLEWLSSLPFVDPERIGFYGLSYGGTTAMRVPAVLEQYCLSICSANFNDWIWKNTSIRSPYSYLLTGEYDMPEWNLGDSFDYAEMSYLIAPRPFMVERGHEDNVAPDERVAYEFARTRRQYDLLGIGDQTEMEVFNGGHEINAKGTFAFLRRHLRHNLPGAA